MTSEVSPIITYAFKEHSHVRDTLFTKETSISVVVGGNSRRTTEERKTLELQYTRRFWILIISQNMDRVIQFLQFKEARKTQPFPDVLVLIALLVEAVYLVKMLAESSRNLTESLKYIDTSPRDFTV